MRLPIINKVFTTFEGSPPPPSKEFPLIQFYIGEDIDLQIPLFYKENKALDPNWKLQAIMKSSTQSIDITWLGTLLNGIYHSADNPNMYRIVVPGKITNTLLAGTYWMDIVATEPIGNSNDVIDKTIILARLPISLDKSAYSAKPSDQSPPAVDITIV